MNINKRQFRKWIQALRSGKYNQTRYILHDSQGYCCLGVACDILIPHKLKNLNGDGKMIGWSPYNQSNVPKWLKLINDDFKIKTGTYLMACNDILGMSFNEIADVLELVYEHKMLD